MYSKHSHHDIRVIQVVEVGRSSCAARGFGGPGRGGRWAAGAPR